MRRRLRSQRGQAFVETAIAALVFLGCVFAVIEAGVVMWTYLTLEHAITVATRFATTQQTVGTLSRPDSIRSVMRQQAPGITINDGEFSFQNITDGTADAGGGNDVIRITVRHPYQPLFPLSIPPLMQASTMTVTSTMQNEPPPP